MEIRIFKFPGIRLGVRPSARPSVYRLRFHENMKIRILKFSYKIRLGVRPSARPSVCYSCVRPPSVHHPSTVRQLLHRPTVRACTSQPAIDTINYILMKIQKFEVSKFHTFIHHVFSSFSGKYEIRPPAVCPSTFCQGSNFVRPSVVPPSASPRVRIRPCVRPCDQPARHQSTSAILS